MTFFLISSTAIGRNPLMSGASCVSTNFFSHINTILSSRNPLMSGASCVSREEWFSAQEKAWRGRNPLMSGASCVSDIYATWGDTDKQISRNPLMSGASCVRSTLRLPQEWGSGLVSQSPNERGILC